MLQLGYDRTAADGSEIHLDMHPSVLLDQHFYLQPTASLGRNSPDPHPGPAAGTRHRDERPVLRTLHPEYVDSVWFADFDSDFPLVDGASRLRVVDVGRATNADLAGRRLHGALALVTHSDAVPIAEQSNRASATAPRSSSSATTALATSLTLAAPA